MKFKIAAIVFCLPFATLCAQEQTQNEEIQLVAPAEVVQSSEAPLPTIQGKKETVEQPKKSLTLQRAKSAQEKVKKNAVQSDLILNAPNKKVESVIEPIAESTVEKVSAKPTQSPLGAILSNSRQSGVVIQNVEEGGPLQRAGMRNGDRIIAIASGNIASTEEAAEILKILSPGDRVEIEYVRNNRKNKGFVVIGKGTVTPSNTASASANTAPNALPNIDTQPNRTPSNVGNAPLNDPIGRADEVVVNANSRPSLGVTIVDSFQGQNFAGARVSSFLPNSSARDAGIKRGAVIIAVDGQRVSSSDGLSRYIATKKPGDTLELTYFEQNKLKQNTVLLGGTVPVAQASAQTTGPSTGNRPIRDAIQQAADQIEIIRTPNFRGLGRNPQPTPQRINVPSQPRRLFRRFRR